MAKTTERRKYPTVLRYPGGKSRIIYYLFRKNRILRTSRNTVRVSLVVGLESSFVLCHVSRYSCLGQ